MPRQPISTAHAVKMSASPMLNSENTLAQPAQRSGMTENHLNLEQLALRMTQMLLIPSESHE